MVANAQKTAKEKAKAQRAKAKAANKHAPEPEPEVVEPQPRADGFVLFTKQSDGLLAQDGVFRARRYVAQYKMAMESEWGPRADTLSPMESKRAKEIMYGSGPFKYDHYRFIPIQDDSPEHADAIARLRNLPKRQYAKKESELAALLRSGTLKGGMNIIAKFRDHEFIATIEDNATITFKGKSFSSLSAAGAAAKGIIAGKPMATDGWTFWTNSAGEKLPRRG